MEIHNPVFFISGKLSTYVHMFASATQAPSLAACLLCHPPPVLIRGLVGNANITFLANAPHIAADANKPSRLPTRGNDAQSLTGACARIPWN